MFLLDIPEPKNCADCLFCDAERGFCYLSTTDGTLKTTKNVTEYADHYTKPDWCPASKKFTLKIAQDKRAKMLEQYYMNKGENE